MIRFLFFTVLILGSNIFSIDLPKEPSLPDTNNTPSEKPQKVKTNNRNVRGEHKGKSFDIKIVLCSSKELKGKINLPSDEIQFSHSKDGIQYKKNLKLQAIKSIHIINWNRQKLKQKSEGTVFQFFPNLLSIQTTDGEEYNTKDVAKLPIHRLKIENNFGETFVYSYWLDLLDNSGKWDSGLSYKTPENCLNEVVKEINFLQDM